MSLEGSYYFRGFHQRKGLVVPYTPVATHISPPTTNKTLIYM